MPAFGAAMIEVEPDLQRFGPSLRRQLTSNAVNRDVDRAGRDSGRLFGRAFSLAFGGFVVAGGLAAYGLAKFGKFAVDTASDTQEAWSKVSVVFDDQADLIGDWSKTTAKAFGISRREALEAAGNFGNMFTTIGLGVEENAKMSKSLVELAADMASFNNVPIADALEKLRAGLAGEAEPLRTMGVLLSEAAVKAKAYELGIAEVGAELTEAEKVQARYALIMEQTAVQQGDAVRTGNDLAGLQKRLGATWEDLAGQLGTLLIPVVEKFFNFLLTDGIPALESLLAEIEDNWPTIKQTAETVWDGVRTVVGEYVDYMRTTGIPLIQEIVAFIQRNWPTIKLVAETVWRAVRTAMEEASRFIREEVLPRVQQLHDWIQRNWPQIRATAQQVWTTVTNVIRVTSDTIQVLMGWLDRLWTSFRQDFVSPFMSALRSAKQNGIDPIVSALQGLWSWLGSVYGSFRQHFVGPFLSAMSSAAGAIGDVIGALRSVWNWLESVVDKFNSVKNRLSSGLKIPGTGGGGFGFDDIWKLGVPGLPIFHSGGVVPGRPGQDVPTILQAGEMVLTRNQQAQLFTGGGMDVHVHAPAVAPLDERELARAVSNAQWLASAGR